MKLLQKFDNTFFEAQCIYKSFQTIAEDHAVWSAIRIVPQHVLPLTCMGLMSASVWRQNVVMVTAVSASR